MRTRFTETRRTIRGVLTVTAIAALSTGGLVLSGGLASAETTLQANSCTAGVTGVMGDQVAITGASVKKLVETGANKAGTLALGGTAANDIAKINTIVVGRVGNAASTQVPGDVIGGAVAQALNNAGSWGLGLNPQKTLKSIADTVTASCGLTAYASDYRSPSEAPTTQPGTTQPGTGTPAPQQSGLPLGTGNAYAPPSNYGNIPMATPGVALPPGARYGAPGTTSPEFGILGADPAATGEPAVQNTGNADALAANETTGGVQLPMLLAVVALAGVTAGLVRTWVLRRV